VERGDLRLSSERAAIGVWLLITACMLLLVYAFLTFDFSVTYVANNTNRGTPFYYRITALWGALEGSIILWAWMVSLYTLIVVARYRRTQPHLYPWVLAAMLGVSAFFLLVMTIAAPALRAPLPGSRRRPRAQPAARRLGDDHAPGRALPGLHRLHGALRLRHGRRAPGRARSRSCRCNTPSSCRKK